MKLLSLVKLQVYYLELLKLFFGNMWWGIWVGCIWLFFRYLIRSILFGKVSHTRMDHFRVCMNDPNLGRKMILVLLDFLYPYLMLNSWKITKMKLLHMQICFLLARSPLSSIGLFPFSLSFTISLSDCWSHSISLLALGPILQQT